MYDAPLSSGCGFTILRVWLFLPSRMAFTISVEKSIGRCVFISLWVKNHFSISLWVSILAGFRKTLVHSLCKPRILHRYSTSPPCKAYQASRCLCELSSHVHLRVDDLSL